MSFCKCTTMLGEYYSDINVFQRVLSVGRVIMNWIPGVWNTGLVL